MKQTGFALFISLLFVTFAPKAFAGGAGNTCYDNPTRCANQDMGGNNFGLKNPNSWGDSTSNGTVQASGSNNTNSNYGINTSQINSDLNSATTQIQNGANAQIQNTQATINSNTQSYLNNQDSSGGAPTVENAGKNALLYTVPQPYQAATAGAQGTTTPGSQQPYYNGNTTANDGTYNQQSNSQAQQRVVNQNQCYQAQALAQKCCSNPESCLRLSGAGTQGGSAMGQVVQTILGLAANMPSSISSMCGRGKTIADISSGLDLYLANQCRMAVSQCDSSCNGSPSNISTCNQYSGTETAVVGSV